MLLDLFSPPAGMHLRRFFTCRVICGTYLIPRPCSPRRIQNFSVKPNAFGVTGCAAWAADNFQHPLQTFFHNNAPPPACSVELRRARMSLLLHRAPFLFSHEYFLMRHFTFAALASCLFVARITAFARRAAVAARCLPRSICADRSARSPLQPRVQRSRATLFCNK